jgi:PIN domain nuclease of toxin-antitoxin system
VRFLIDTHTLIWWWLEAPALSARARAAMVDPDNEVFVSAVSIIEIAIKVRRGRLSALAEPLANVDRDFTRYGFAHLPVNHLHAREAGLLKGDHRDPFDRLIAAQALTENLVVITRDSELGAFGCRTIW